MLQHFLVYRVIDLIRCAGGSGGICRRIGEKFAVRVWQADGVVNTIPDGKDHGLQGNLDIRARATSGGVAVAGYKDIFFNFEAVYPSIGVSEHTGGRSEKAE